MSVFRDRAYAVLNLEEHQFPNRCLVTGEEVHGLTPIKIAAWDWSALSGSPNKDSKAASMSFGPLAFRIFTLQLPISPLHQKKMHYFGMIIATVGWLLASVATIIWMGAGFFFPWNSWVSLGGIVLGLVILGWGVRIQLRVQAPLRIVSFRPEFVWLAGVQAELLSTFPEWHASVQHESVSKADLVRSTLVSVASFIGGVVLAYFFLQPSLESLSSLNWPGTAGSVVSSTVVSQKVKEGGGGRVGLPAIKRTYFEIKCHYEYSVGGRKYFGERQAFGGNERYSSKSSAEAMLKHQFAVGAPLVVYHAPQHPERSSLARATPIQIAKTAGPMLLAFTVAIVAAVMTYKAWRVRAGNATVIMPNETAG